MNQDLALKILLEGENVFLTGPAGTGKTYLLNNFINISKSRDKYVSVTATTGLAASHLGGNTIHSWSGIGISENINENFVDNLTKSRKEIIKKTDILIIDEISMLHDYRLDMIDFIARKVRKSDQPFGGIQVVLSGDFFQLPPINRGGSRQGDFAFKARSWLDLDLKILYLLNQFRQDKEDFSEILNAIRSGDVRRKHAEKLLNRTNEDFDEEDDITEIHTRNIDVDKINNSKLSEINDDEKTYMQITSGPKKFVETLKKSILAPEELVLKRGALVMAVKNSMTRQYNNGSIGVVVDFEPGTDFPIVEFKNGKNVTMVPDSWELKDGDEKKAEVSQIPLRLAWSITVHKSQGMTLDAAKIDLRKAFVPGMGYVALSRVRDLDNIYLYGINQMALKVDSRVLKFDSYLRKESEKNSKKFEYLNQKSMIDDLKLEVKEKPKKKGFLEKINTERKKYPNAYKKWSKKEDEELKMSVNLGSFNMEELSNKLGRKDSSIKSRLKKLYGEDVIF